MTNGQPADLQEKIKQLTEKRDQLVLRQTRLKVIAEQAEKDYQRVLEEMKQLGTSPETIESDLEKAEAEVSAAVIQYDQDLEAFEKAITEAEKALEET